MNKWVQKLRNIEGAVKTKVDYFADPLRTPSPSVNYIYGRTHGHPFGYSELLWGPPGGGKSLIFNLKAGILHQTDPEAIVVKYDTEMRDDGQLDEEAAKAFGIDLDRMVTYQVNKPAQIFDRFSKDVGELIEAGARVRYFGIDSVNMMQGRREAQQESVEDFTMGDMAQTLGIGFKRILPMLRHHRIAASVIAQQRAEFDQWEIKRGNKTKAAVANAVQHFCEYFVYVARVLNKSGSQDELGQTLEDDSKKDVTDSADKIGHKIQVWMQKSAFGVMGRTGEFTFHYKNGVINQHEEIFRLGVRWGIIERPSVKTYVVNKESFNGKPACLAGLASKPELQSYVIAELLKAEKESKLPMAIGDENAPDFSQNEDPKE